VRRWAVAGLFVLLASCGSASSDGGSASTTTTTVATVTIDDLDGRSFVSTTIDGRDLEPGTQIALSFAEQRISAIAGCSTQNADVTITSGHLEVASPMARTDPIMDCGATRRAQDDWLAAFLTGEPSIALRGSTMHLTSDDVELELEDRF
jgi:hypothetical protein